MGQSPKTLTSPDRPTYGESRMPDRRQPSLPLEAPAPAVEPVAPFDFTSGPETAPRPGWVVPGWLRVPLVDEETETMKENETWEPKKGTLK